MVTLDYVLIGVLLVINTIFALLVKETKEITSIPAKLVLLIPPVSILFVIALNFYEVLVYLVKKLPEYFK
jgi:hypothetical protein